MAIRFILTDYLEQAMAEAQYDKLEEAPIPAASILFRGVVAFGATLRECQEELRSTLEDWILVGLKLRHQLPIIGEIDLNKEPLHESVGTL